MIGRRATVVCSACGLSSAANPAEVEKSRSEKAEVERERVCMQIMAAVTIKRNPADQGG